MYTYKTLVRDKLVDNATIKALFAAALTGSCRVQMENLLVSAGYPQIIISWGGGYTQPNLDADNSTMYLTIECKGTGTEHAYQELGKFRSAILDIIDDTSLAAATAVCYHMRKFSEVEAYDQDEKVWWLKMGFNCHWKQNFNYA